MTHFSPDTTDPQSESLVEASAEPFTESRINEPGINEALIALISDRMGLEIKPQDQAALCHQLTARARTFSPPSLDAYYQHLREASLANQPEWSYISQLITNGESFFFRDKGQCLALKQHLLPDLIRRHATDKKLRICSAGCATGEEAYSLVILLHELLSQLNQNIDQWDIKVYGLDINPASIDHAKAGVYRNWSLRGVDEHQRQTYFRQRGNLFHIAPQFKSQVTFYPFNLVSDPWVQKAEDIFSGAPLHDPLDQLDLIVCRNVFIYFSSRAIAKVINKFYEALNPLGYLLTGHAELHGQNLELFQIKALPESLVFQRPVAKPAFPLSESDLSQPLSEQVLSEDTLAKATKAKENDTPLQQAETLLKNNAPKLALHQAERALQQAPDDPKVLGLMAQIYSELSQTDQAIHYCQAAIEADGCFLAPHYLLAKIFTDQGDFAESKRILKKIIYLEPNAVIAYLELSQLYRREGNLQKSDLMRRCAFDIFGQHLPESNLPESNLPKSNLPESTV